MKIFCVRNAVMLCAATAVAFSSLAKGGDHKFMDAKKVKTVASGNTWETKKVGASGYAYWDWKADGSVCMRLEEKTGKCDDKGKWKLDGDRLCFELEWFGAALGLKSACVGVVDQGGRRYLGVDNKGSTLFDFTVLK